MKTCLFTCVTMVLLAISSWGGTSQTWTIEDIHVTRLDLGEGVANCYVVSAGNQDAYVIDPGGNATYIIEYLRKEQLKVLGYLVTHGHNDHIKGLPQLVQEDADLFVRTMGEMCVRNQTVVHAWCLMSNHYHLLLETPIGNLVDAMKWFQGTFTQRYNARHKLWGHLFQGRYKAKVIDDSDPSYFCKVSEYIHLNPADAGLVQLGKLADYPWSSYGLYLGAPSKRPDWLVVQKVLNACGIPDDSLKSRRAYEAYMELRHQALLARSVDIEERAVWEHMERGWMHGGTEFRKRMTASLKDQGKAQLKSVVDAEQKRDLSEASASAVLEKCLTYFRINPGELCRLPKSDPAKMLMAGLLRYHYPVRAEWVSHQLAMGHFTTVSRAMRFYDGVEGKWAKEKQRILKFIG